MPRLAFRILAVLVVASCVASPPTDLARNRQAFATDASRDATVLTLEELHSELLGFADFYQYVVARAADEAADLAGTPEARSRAQSVKLLGATAAFGTAAGPNPEAALLDMIVLVTLQRSAWEDEPPDGPLGHHTGVLVKAFQELEEDILEIASGLMSAEQVTQLEDGIETWHEAHPGQAYVELVSFRDLAAERSLSTLVDAEGNPGFLGVSDALREVERVRLLGERSLYQIERAPLLLNWQVLDTYYDFIGLPETRQLLADVSASAAAADKLSESSVRITALLESLPERIREEREALMEDLISNEAPLTRMTGEVRATLEQGTVLASEVGRILTQLDVALVSADRLAAHFDAEPALEGGATEEEPLELEDLLEASRDVRATLTELDEALDSAEVLVVSPEWKTRIDELGESLRVLGQWQRETEDRFYIRVLIVLGALFVGISGVFVGLRVARSRATRRQA